jgi:hypothetical protein
MATFDPDAYLSKSSKPFDPDAYLSKQTAPASTPKTFDPDAYLKRGAITLDEDVPAVQTKLAKTTQKPINTVEDLQAEAQRIRGAYKTEGLLPQSAPVEGAGGAAFGVFPQAKARQQNVEKIRAEQKAKEIPFDVIVNNDEFFNIVNQGMQAGGQPAFDPKKETREQFVNRFYGQRRFAEYGLLFGALPELVALKNSNIDQARALALAQRVYEKAEDAPDKVRAAVDITKAILSDLPLYVLGPGFGRAAAGTVVRKGMQVASKDAATRALEKQALSKAATRAEVLTSAGTEAAIGGAGDITGQRTEIERARRLGETEPEYNPWSTVLSAVIPGAVSGAVSAKTAKARTIKERGEIISKELVDRNITTASPSAPLTSTEKQLANAMTRDFETVHSDYVKAYGKSLLDEIDPAMAATDAKVRDEFSRSAVRMAMQMMKDKPEEFGWNPAKEQISDAIYRTFSQIETIDDVAFEAALNKAGLTAEQFAAAAKSSVSSGASQMQALSVAARWGKRRSEIDPGFDKRMKELYSVDTDQVGSWSKASEGIKRVERESKAIITSGIDTLARNTIGNLIGVSMKAGVQMIEGVRYSVGTALSAADGEKLTVLQKTMGDAWKDAIGTLYYMKRNGLAEDITEKVLENNPTFLSRISGATQDTDLNDVSKFARWSQTFNAAMDGMYRRASFAASLERELGRVGIDLYKDVLAANKVIPSSILKKALDDSFKDTFSYTPQMYAKSFSAFEDFFEKGGARFVKGVEAVPLASLVIPFPRFVTNALAFQYKYSPLGFIGARQYVNEATKLRAAGQLEKAEMVAREGATKAVQATVGFGMLLAAIDYRRNNPDVNWNEVKTDNGITDVKSIFPIAPYLGIADIWVRDATDGIGKAQIKEILENIVGFKTPAGTTNSFITGIVDVFNSEEKWESVKQSLSKVAGDFAGRFTQPFVAKQIFDLVDLVRGDEAQLARDPNVLTADTEGGRLAQAAYQRVQAKLPFVKEELAPAVVRFKEEPPKKQGEEQEQSKVSKEGEFFNRLVGFRTAAPRTEAEKEIVKHSVDLYKVYGRPSGDKDFDRLFIQNTNRYAIDFVNDDIKKSQYQSLTSEQKQERINNVIGKAVEEAKKITEATFAQEFPEKLNRINYLRAPSKVKKIVNDLYAADHNGITMEEAKAYDLFPKYKDLAIGPTKYAKGGMVQQMTSLFGKHSWA